MKKTRLSLLICAVLALCSCIAGVCVNSSADTNTSGNIVSTDFNKIKNGDTIIIGNYGDYPLEWQVLDNSKTSTNTGEAGMFLISKYLMSAQSGSKSSGTYSEAQNAMSLLTSDLDAQMESEDGLHINATERKAIVSTSKQDSASQITNDGTTSVGGNEYDGYTDLSEAYGIKSPSKIQKFKSNDSAISGKQLFFLSADEVNTYIPISYGNANYGIEKIVRRPCVYSFCLPDNYSEQATADNREWWLRSVSDADATNRGIVARAIRNDTSLYNALDVHGLIGNRAQSDSAWLRPGCNIAKNEIAFMYQVKLTTKAEPYFAVSSECEDTFYETLKIGNSADGTVSAYNAWKPAYKTLNDITVTNAKLVGTDLSVNVSGLGSNMLGYMLYNADSNLVKYGKLEKNSNGKYCLDIQNKEYTVKLFAYDALDNTVETSSLCSVEYSTETVASIGNAGVKNGIVVYLNGKQYKVLDSDAGYLNDAKVTFKNNDGNNVQNNEAVFLAAANSRVYESPSGTYVSPNKFNSATELQTALEKAVLLQSSDKYLKNSLLTVGGSGGDVSGKQFFSLSNTEADDSHYKHKFENAWYRDDAFSGASKYILPATNILKENILMINRVGEFDSKGNKIEDLSGDASYELTLKLSDEFNGFKITNASFDYDDSVVRVYYEDVQKCTKELDNGYASYVSVVIADNKGFVKKYYRSQEIYSDPWKESYIDVDMTGFESGYSLYVFNEVSKDTDSRFEIKNNVRFATVFQKVDLRNISGSATISGEGYSGKKITLKLNASNISLTDSNTKIKWVMYQRVNEFIPGRFDGSTRTVYREVATILEGNGLNASVCTLPDGYNDFDYYVAATVSNSEKQGTIKSNRIQMQKEASGNAVVQKGTAAIKKGVNIYYGDIISPASGSIFQKNTAIPWQVISADSGNAIGTSDHLVSTNPDGLGKSTDGNVSNNDAILLMSKYVLGIANYNRKDKTISTDYNKWEGSDVEYWCKNFIESIRTDSKANSISNMDNGELEASLFLSKFDAQKTFFLKSWIDNQVVDDRFFLLSAEEVATFINKTMLSKGKVARAATNSTGNASTWWLRSARPKVKGDENVDEESGVSVGAAIVNEAGEVTTNDVSYGNGMRPAFNLDKNKIAMMSLAVDGKNTTMPEYRLIRSETVKQWQLKNTDIKNSSDGDNVGWKLTLFDSEHAGFNAYTVDNSSYSYEVNYSGAKTGPNEYLSFIRMNSDNKIIAYQRIVNLNEASMANGTVDFELSKLLINSEDGCTDYIINEQCNGDYQTDYCSPFKELSEYRHYRVYYYRYEITTNPPSVEFHSGQYSQNNKAVAGKMVTVTFDDSGAVKVFDAKLRDRQGYTVACKCDIDWTKKEITFIQPNEDVDLVVYTDTDVVKMEYIAEEGGTVSLGKEYVDKYDNVKPRGSTAKANEGYKFIGWYTKSGSEYTLYTKDEKCVQTPKSSDPKYEDATYYARFEYVGKTLKIINKNMDETESAIYEISADEGSLKDNPIKISVSGGCTKSVMGVIEGKTYYIRKMDDWSWRYSGVFDSNPTGTLDIVNNVWKITIGEDGAEVIDNNRCLDPKWLCGENIKVNVFK